MGWFMAQFYDSLVAAAEESFLREERVKHLSQVSGSILEVGSGTGATLGLYPEDGVSRLVLSEPDKYMRANLVKKLDTAKKSGTLKDSSNSALLDPEVVSFKLPEVPYEESSFDYVVSFLVHCSVQQPEASMKELKRVLKPGGKLLFLEHIQAPRGSWERSLQRAFGWPWFFLCDGCDCQRDTRGLIETTFGSERVDANNFHFKASEHYLACSWTSGVAVKTS